MVTTFRRKQNRLPLPNYADTHVYLLTLACEKRRREFNDALVTFCLEKLSAVAIKHRVGVLAYCFMPDHLHLLAYAANPSFVPAFVRDFKQIAGLMFNARTGRTLWQKSRHDHILRSEESARRAAQYIAANPVRAGIVGDPAEYPYTGSFVWDRSAVVEG
jgi:REP element-mobilizing transposase RayT